MAEDYLKRDIPVVVTDAMEGWPVFEKFSFQLLYEVMLLKMKTDYQYRCESVPGKHNHHLSPQITVKLHIFIW